MSRPHQFAALLVGLMAISGAAQSGNPPTITSVTVSANGSGVRTMSINGQNFGSAAPDWVTLGSTALRVVPNSSPASLITATMPVIAPPGSYLLSIGGRGGSWKISFDAELGAVGLTGATGKSGLPGGSPRISMITTTSPDAGGCRVSGANGYYGTEIDSADGNTKTYVCNGRQGGVGWPGPTGASCPAPPGLRGVAGPTGPAGAAGQGVVGPVKWRLSWISQGCRGPIRIDNDKQAAARVLPDGRTLVEGRQEWSVSRGRIRPRQGHRGCEHHRG